jgi:hypothetical protein
VVDEFTDNDSRDVLDTDTDADIVTVEVPNTVTEGLAETERDTAPDALSEVEGEFVPFTDNVAFPEGDRKDVLETDADGDIVVDDVIDAETDALLLAERDTAPDALNEVEAEYETETVVVELAEGDLNDVLETEADGVIVTDELPDFVTEEQAVTERDTVPDALNELEVENVPFTDNVAFPEGDLNDVFETDADGDIVVDDVIDAVTEEQAETERDTVPDALNELDVENVPFTDIVAFPEGDLNDDLETDTDGDVVVDGLIDAVTDALLLADGDLVPEALYELEPEFETETLVVELTEGDLNDVLETDIDGVTDGDRFVDAVTEALLLAERDTAPDALYELEPDVVTVPVVVEFTESDLNDVLETEADADIVTEAVLFAEAEGDGDTETETDGDLDAATDLVGVLETVTDELTEADTVWLRLFDELAVIVVDAVDVRLTEGLGETVVVVENDTEILADLDGDDVVDREIEGPADLDGDGDTVDVRLIEVDADVVEETELERVPFTFGDVEGHGVCDGVAGNETYVRVGNAEWRDTEAEDECDGVTVTEIDSFALTVTVPWLVGETGWHVPPPQTLLAHSAAVVQAAPSASRR